MGLHDLTPIGHNVLVYIILHAYNFSFLKHFTLCKNSIFRNQHEAHFMQKKKNITRISELLEFIVSWGRVSSQI